MTSMLWLMLMGVLPCLIIQLILLWRYTVQVTRLMWELEVYTRTLRQSVQREHDARVARLSENGYPVEDDA